jgi:hypothetical protein
MLHERLIADPLASRNRAPRVSHDRLRVRDLAQSLKPLKFQRLTADPPDEFPTHQPQSTAGMRTA